MGFYRTAATRLSKKPAYVLLIAPFPSWCLPFELPNGFIRRQIASAQPVNADRKQHACDHGGRNRRSQVEDRPAATNLLRSTLPTTRTAPLRWRDHRGGTRLPELKPFHVVVNSEQGAEGEHAWDDIVTRMRLSPSGR
jgi:hypothetical protein